MKQFTDNTGKTWAINIVVGGDLVERMSNDPVLLVDVLFAVLKTEADERGVSDEDFAYAMGGDSLYDAYSAFLDEMIDYLPPVQRPLLRKAADKSGEMMEMVVARGLEHLESGKLEAALMKEMEDTLNGAIPGGS